MKYFYSLILCLSLIEAANAQCNLTFATRQGDLMQVTISNASASGVTNTNPQYGSYIRYNALQGVTADMNMTIYFQTGNNNVTTIQHKANITLVPNMEINYFITVGFINGQVQVVLNEANRSPLCPVNVVNTGTGQTGTTGNNGNMVICNVKNTNPMMAKADFDRLKAEVDKVTFDDDMVPMMKSALRFANIQADQLKELLKMMTFDNNKVDFAKYAYDYVCDKQNFYVIRECFTTSYYYQEVEKFINSK